MKALILGCGEMGEEALQELFLHGDLREIAVATRNPAKVNAVLSRLGPGKSRVQVERVDLHTKYHTHNYDVIYIVRTTHHWY